MPLFRLGLAAALLAFVAAPLPRPGTVEGVVRDAETGDALPGANVGVEGTALGAATDADGRFRLADVPAGRQSLRVSLVGYDAETVGVEVTEGRTARVEVELSAADVLDEVTAESGDRGGLTVRGGRAAEARTESASPPPAPAFFSSPTPSAADAAAPAYRAAPADREAPADRRRAPRQPGLLTAGDVDDGLNWDAYLGYVRRALDAARPDGQRRGASEAFSALDLGNRVVVRVLDQVGHPVAGARVTVTAEGGTRARRLVTEAGTDGRLALFPSYDFGPDAGLMRVAVSEPGGGRPSRTRTVAVGRSADAVVEVRLPIRVAERPRALDLAFVIDVTGSMGDELRYLTDEFESIVERVEARYPGVDLRFGLVAYRDRGDQFVVRRYDFTRSAQEMRQRLGALEATGGGDYPEAMDEALEAALDLDWRTGSAARVAFLVADAPPHADRTDRTLDAVREARARGLRIYPVAASGVADEAEYLMRAAAVLTQARHLFLTDDSGVGLPHAEPKIPCYQVTALNGLLTRVIASELEGRRVEASRDEVVREVGDYDAGVCEAPAVVQRPAPRRSRLGYVE